MADDITLTVRVRDMSQGALNRLQGNMNRMQRDMHRIGSTARGTSQSFQRLRQDTNSLSTQLTRMIGTGQLTRRELTRMQNDADLAAQGLRRMSRAGTITRSEFRSLSREIGDLRARMLLLGRDGTVFDRTAARLLLLQNRMRDTSTHAGRLRRAMSGIGERLTGTLRGAVLGVGSLFSALGKLTSHIKLSSRWAAILLAALVLIGPVAQALGAVLVTALGGAFIALGAFALRGSAAVKKAFSDMRTSISGDLKAAAEPMEGFLVNGMARVATAFRQLQPLLQQAFTAAGPLIENFFGAFTDLAQKAMPGIVNSLQAMGPVMEGFRAAMGEIGKGIGEMFDAMTSGGGAEALADVWATLGQELRNLLVGIGEFIKFAAQSETVTALMVTAFRTLSGILNIVQSGLSILDGLFGFFIKDLALGADALAMFGENAQAVATSLVPTGQSLDSLRSQLKEVEDEIVRIQKLRDDSDIKGPAKEYALRGEGATEDDLTAAQQRRRDLLAAISAAESEAAAASRDHAAAVASLTQQIRDLNNANLARFNAQAAMEQSIADAAEKVDEFTGKVRIQNGVFDLSHENSRKVYEALAKVAENTAAAAAQAAESHAPLSEINAVWARGREQLEALGTAFGVPKEQLGQFIELVLQTPESVETKLSLEKHQAETSLANLSAKYDEVDGKELKTKAAMDIFRAMERASQVESRIKGLDGLTATTRVTTVFTEVHNVEYNAPRGRSVHDIVGATGGLFTGSGFTKRGFATGGRISGPGTGTSDDIFAPWLSDGEFVINARQTAKYLPLIQAINNDRLKLGPMMASGGKVSSGTKDARKELASQFGISLFGRLSGARLNPFEKGLGTPGDMGSLVSTLNSLMGSIKKAFDGKTEKNLVNRLTSTGKALIAQEKKLTKVNASLEKAKTKLDDLKQSAASLRESVTSGVLGESAITRAATGDRAATLPDIMTTMQGSRDKATAFARALADLKAKGFSGEIIRQVAEAGIGGGGLETAGALLTASASDIASFNSMQAEISAAAKAAGVTAADAMYGAGIKAAEGLVNGLTAQKKAIEKAMMDIAKSMEKAIKKALGIKSPSKVMQDVGHNTAQGFALGMTNNRDVDTAWSSMLNRGPAAGGTSGVATGGGTYVIPISIGNKPLDEIILDSNRRTVRTRGGNVQNVFGQRNS